jgi:uroporphyrinogen-III synthase
MRALITRPQQEAVALAEALKARGLDPIIEPLLVVNEMIDPAQPLNVDGIQAILVTSSNGARALARATDRRDVQVFAVGDATASTARNAGFTHIESAGGNVGALAQLAYAALSPEAGDLLYVSGTATAGDLVGPLERAGFTVRRVVLYDAKAADRLSAQVVAGLKEGSIDIVLFFSPRTAEAFAKLARKARIATAFKRCSAYCISQAVAMKAAALDWKAIRVAALPTQESLLTLIDNDLMNFGSAGAVASSAPAEADDEEDEIDVSVPGPIIAAPAVPAPVVPAPVVPALVTPALVTPALVTPAPAVQAPAPVTQLAPPMTAGELPQPIPASPAPPPPPPPPPQSAPSMPPVEAPKRSGGFWRVVAFALLVFVAAGFGFFAGRPGGPLPPELDGVVSVLTRVTDGVRVAIGRLGNVVSGTEGGGTAGTAGTGTAGTGTAGRADGGAAGGSDAALAARIEQLERSIARMANERMANERRASPPATAPSAEVGAEIEGRLAATARMMAEVMERVDRIEAAGAQRGQPGAVPPATVSPAVQARLAEVEARLAASEQALAELRRHAEAPQPNVNAPAIAALETRIDVLSRELAAARDRVGQVASTVATATAQQQAGRGGEALILALGQLSDAVSRGVSFADELQAVRGFAGNLGLAANDPIETLALYADAGISTRLNLQLLFPEMARRVMVAHNPMPQDRIIDRLIRKVQGLISVRPLSEGANLPDDAQPGTIVALAEARMRADDVAGAVAALSELKGPAADAAASWVAEAQARLKAQEALRQLRTLVIAQHGGAARR